MDKLKMQTPDLTDKNIERIAELFPNVITETRDENGALKKGVDFDLLRTALSKDIVEGDDERYRLDWPGKKASLLKANTPITQTLRPCREESVNFDTTENLYIEGDNFEVLKILQESYLCKVKMIYIDPPYNTGNDFIYKDDFKKTKDEYEDELGVEDEEGGKLFRNTDSNGRFHSDWLSMMYERLLVARDLLRDDGLLFVNIGSEEIANLKKVLEEIYGEENLIEIVPRVVKSTSFKGNFFSPSLDYILCCAKNISRTTPFTEGVIKKQFPKLEKDGERKGEHYRDDTAFYLSSLDITRGSYSQRYWVACPDGSKVIPPGKTFPPQKGVAGDGVWRWGPETYEKQKHLLVFKESTRSPLLDEKGNPAKYNVYTKSYLSDREEAGKLPRNYFIDSIQNRKGTSLLKSIGIPFPFSKPIELIEWLMKISNISNNDIVLDFFSGSATTAQSVMQMNAENKCNLKFIMIQLPERVDEVAEANKFLIDLGRPTNICEIGKERIRRAGKKIVEELKAKNQQLELGQEPIGPSKLDIGFRVYKIDDSNMKDVFYHPASLDQQQLAFLESNIKEDRTPEDLLTQVLLDLGLELSLPIETKKIGKNTVYIVQTNALVACFDNDIDFKILDEIASLKPFKVVFRDASFKDDKDRINVEERFKRLSPETKVTVI